MKSLTRFAVAGSIVAVLVVFVAAQERREQPQTNPPRTQPDNRATQQVVQPFHGQSGQGDHQLASWLISDNEGEVAIAKFALDKSDSSEVKEFAEQMIQDHNDFLKKLQQFAPASAAGHQDTENTVPSSRSEKGRATEDRTAAENRSGNAAPRSPTNPQNTPNRENDPQRPNRTTDAKQPATRVDQQPTSAHAIDLARVKQEIGKQCVETFKKELGQKKGKEFDKCYMGQQIGAHLHMGDTLMVMKNYASPQLRSVIADGEKTADKHLDHAKKIMKDLEGEKRTERTASAKDD